MEMNNSIAKMLITLMEGLARNKHVFLNDLFVYHVTPPYICHDDRLYVKEGNITESRNFSVVYVKDYIFELLRWIAEKPADQQLETLIQLSSFITSNDIVKVPHLHRGPTWEFINSEDVHGRNNTRLIREYFPSFTIESGETEVKNCFEWWLEICAKHRIEDSRRKVLSGCGSDMYHLRKSIRIFGLKYTEGYELGNLVKLAKEHDIDPEGGVRAFALVASKVFFDSIGKHEPSKRTMGVMIYLFISLFCRYGAFSDITLDGKDDMSNALSAYNDIKGSLSAGEKMLIKRHLADISSMVVKYKTNEEEPIRLLKA